MFVCGFVCGFACVSIGVCGVRGVASRELGWCVGRWIVCGSAYMMAGNNFISLRGAHVQVHWTISSHDTHTFTFYCINIVVRLNEMVYFMVSDVQKAPKYQCFSLLAALKLSRSTTTDAEKSQCSSVSVEESRCCLASHCREVLWQTDGCW